MAGHSGRAAQWVSKAVSRTSRRAWGFLLLVVLSPTLEVRAQGWEKAPALPTDMRDILSTINQDSNLRLIYQKYRENRDGLQRNAERITLEDAIKRGLSTSPILAKTVAEIQESQWNGVAITREWVPRLSVRTSDPGVLGYGTNSTSIKTKTEGSSAKENILVSNGFQSNPYADLSWSFFDPTRGVRQNARGSRTQASRNRLTFGTRELIYQIQSAYTDLQRALEREKDTIELFNQAIAIYINAHRQGSPDGEKSRFEAQAVSFLIDRINAHKESIQAADALANVINLEPGKLALPSEKPDLIPIWPLSRADSIRLALQQREELRANAWEFKALMSDARALRLKVLPALALSGQTQRISRNQVGDSFSNNGPGTLTRTSGYNTFVGLTFDWKVFDGGIRNAEANATEAKAQQTLEEDKLQRLDITQEVGDAYAQFVASKILVDAARADVSASRLSLKSALEDYAAGRHDDAGTTVVQALSKLQGALSNYRKLVADQNTSIYKLYRTTSTWPTPTEALVKAQYERWLPTSPAPALPGTSAKQPTPVTTPKKP